MTTELDLSPFLAQKKKIEATIEGHMAQVAVLRKRQEALQQAIDVLRSSDEELGLFQIQKFTPRAARQSRSPVDEQNVENRIVHFINSSDQPRSMRDILTFLTNEGIPCSEWAARKIINQCPLIVREGERHLTRYSTTAAKEMAS